MKCDELKDYDIMDIEAMDDERLEKSESGKIQVTRVYIKSDVDAAITQLKQKLESVQASMYADVVDANMENRRLKRALWLSRANSAEGQFFYWCARFGVESGFTKADILGYPVNTKRRLRTIGEWIEYWKNVKSKCLKKAEEYK